MKALVFTVIFSMFLMVAQSAAQASDAPEWTKEAQAFWEDRAGEFILLDETLFSRGGDRQRISHRESLPTSERSESYSLHREADLYFSAKTGAGYKSLRGAWASLEGYINLSVYVYGMIDEASAIARTQKGREFLVIDPAPSRWEKKHGRKVDLNKPPVGESSEYLVGKWTGATRLYQFGRERGNLRVFQLAGDPTPITAKEMRDYCRKNNLTRLPKIVSFSYRTQVKGEMQERRGFRSQWEIIPPDFR